VNIGGRRVPADQLVSVTDHVEGHVAALMRRPGTPRTSVLVVNNAPCAQIPFGCDRILPGILPAGSSLTIYVADPTAVGGARFHRTYHGNGKAIAS
jgi:hypothetical protein